MGLVEACVLIPNFVFFPSRNQLGDRRITAHTHTHTQLAG
jgi:hypothetical protein